MLALSRSQTEIEPDKLQPVNLQEVLRELIAQNEQLFASRQQSIEADLPAAAWVMGDEMKLHQLFRNLFDNASRYGTPGSTVRVALLPETAGWRFSIANEGAVIPEAMREKVFEPYTRLHGQDIEGNGLGLAIAREVARQHHADIALASLAGESGTVVSVVFPAVETPASA